MIHHNPMSDIYDSYSPCRCRCLGATGTITPIMCTYKYYIYQCITVNIYPFSLIFSILLSSYTYYKSSVCSSHVQLTSVWRCVCVHGCSTIYAFVCLHDKNVCICISIIFYPFSVIFRLFLSTRIHHDGCYSMLYISVSDIY